MDKILVIFKTDSDTALFHPETKEKLKSDCGDYYLFVKDKVKFTESLFKNDFQMSTKVYSALIDYLTNGDSLTLLALEQSCHYFGNYSIDIVYNFCEI